MLRGQLSEVISIDLGLYLVLNKFHGASPLWKESTHAKHITFLHTRGREWNQPQEKAKIGVLHCNVPITLES